MYGCHPADNWITIMITNNLLRLRQISCNIQSLKLLFPANCYWFYSISISFISMLC